MNQILNAEYKALPSLSPYIKTNRYSTPKEDHKFFEQKLKEKVDTTQFLNVVDVGCGNGELLYYLKKQFPHWQLTGYDFTREFIDTGKNFDGLSGVKLIHSDMFDIVENYDIVLCDGVIQIFCDIQKPLEKILNICKNGGYVFITGLFNKFDIEVRLQFCDNTNPASKDIWRSDFNQHSQQSIKRLVQKKVSSIEFEDVTMNVDLPFNSNMPSWNFTFRDANGKNIITNGQNIIVNKTMLMIKV